jgi:hypothetical protein
VLLTLLLLAASVELGGASFRPASYVMGRARALLNVQLASTAVYLGGFLWLVQILGLEGIGVASVAAAVVSFLGAGVLVQRGCRERLQADRQVETPARETRATAVEATANSEA